MNIRVQVGDQIYDVEVGDLNSRPIEATVAGAVYAVWPEELADTSAGAEVTPEPAAVTRPAPPLPQPTGAGAVSNADIVVAPLPGDIVAVAVKTGDAVTAGQLLCTVESMKMNNPVRSPRAAIVAEVMVTVGAHVTPGQPMVRLR